MDGAVREGADDARTAPEREYEQLRETVRKQVRRMGITDAEADQVTDDCLDAWRALTPGPGGIGGDKPEAKLAGFVANRCKVARRAIIRARARDSQHYESVMAGRNDDPTRRDEPMCIDVQNALAALSGDERRVCDAIMAGIAQREIANRFGMTRHEIFMLLGGVRERFAALGLDGWLTEPPAANYRNGSCQPFSDGRPDYEDE